MLADSFANALIFVQRAHRRIFLLTTMYFNENADNIYTSLANSSKNNLQNTTFSTFESGWAVKFIVLQYH